MTTTFTILIDFPFSSRTQTKALDGAINVDTVAIRASILGKQSDPESPLLEMQQGH
jgi:hypothetical protein